MRFKQAHVTWWFISLLLSYYCCHGWVPMSFRQSGRLQLMTTQHLSQPRRVQSCALYSTRRKPSQKRNVKKNTIATNTEGFVDVDFERVEPPPVAPKAPKQPKASTKQTTKPRASKAKTTTRSSTKKSTKTSTTKSAATNNKPKTLIDISLETGDPNWNKARIPFFHPNGQNFIDCKLAFMVDIEVEDSNGQPQKISYGIAVPFDEAVAIVEENPKKGNVMYFHPDDVVDGNGSSGSSSVNKSGLDPDEMLELMEMMAGQVQEQLGESLTLCKTPRVLTIRGEGLKELTENWDTELLPDPASVEDLLSTMSSSKKKTSTRDGDDELYQDELQEFYDFMKDELGQEEFDKTMNQDLNEDDIDPELLELFDVPGLSGATADGADGMEEILQSMLVDLQEQEGSDGDKKINKNSGKGFDKKTTLEKESEFITKPAFMDGAALKLLSFNFRGGKKAYSLVKLMQPFVIIGKYAGEMTDDNIVDGDDEDGYDFDDFYDYEADDDDGNEDGSDATTSSVAASQQKKPRMIRFELLTPDEEKVVIPKLEELCRNDLDAAGLSLKP